MLETSHGQINQRRFFPARCWATVALALAVLLAAAVRLRLLTLPLERDEGEFAYMGQLMLQGLPPYKLAFNMKLPGTCAAYAAIMSVFGQTTPAIHLGFLLVNLASLAMLFFIARRLLDSARGAVACLCFALFSLSPGVLGFEGHATHLVILAALGGWLALLKAQERGGAWGFWWSGLLFGISFLCKQPGLFFGMFGAALLLRQAAQAAGPQRRLWLARLGIFCAAVAAPFLAVCLWMLLAGTFHRFWFWTMVYAPYHATHLGEEQMWWQLGDFSRRAAPLLWWGLPAAAGLVWLIVDKRHNEARFAVLCLLGFSLMALAASLYFFRHYFILLLPAVSLLIAAAVGGAARMAGWRAAACAFALACAGFVAANRALWFQWTPEAVCRSLYQREVFPEAMEIARRIRQDSAPGDTIEVLGSEPEIYFYARRHSASGYLYMYDLMRSTPYAPAMQLELRHDIETARPLFLVVVNVPTSWARTINSDPALLDWSRAYEKQFYDLAGEVFLSPAGPADFLWGAEAATRKSDAPLSVSILKRRPGL
jgi:hypothetical protein